MQTLISTWTPWPLRLEHAGLELGPAERLMVTTSRLSNDARQLELIRNQAARTSASTLTNNPATTPSKSPARRR
ncbi:hypothetical protein AB0H82_32765 [Streptomyces sp. NPDC050732]|uniref:hypothetical protein n=1 Tax=Streptomyces sp. NPDC050732 TaxID=3154632 RepID=UPI00342018B3